MGEQTRNLLNKGVFFFLFFLTYLSYSQFYHGLVAGANPIEMQILSQVFNVFVLPLVIVGIMLLVNNKKIMKGYKTSIWINLGLVAALFFSCLISYNGVQALVVYF